MRFGAGRRTKAATPLVSITPRLLRRPRNEDRTMNKTSGLITRKTRRRRGPQKHPACTVDGLHFAIREKKRKEQRVRQDTAVSTGSLRGERETERQHAVNTLKIRARKKKSKKEKPEKEKTTLHASLLRVIGKARRFMSRRSHVRENKKSADFRRIQGLSSRVTVFCCDIRE